MSINFREILKKNGITQQELADYLGITRQYLNNYLDETLEEPKMPQKYIDNIMFLFECKTREELFDEDINRSSKTIKKRMNTIKATKESIDNLFNIEHEKKLELFKIVEFFQNLSKLDHELLESFAIFMESAANDKNYQAVLSYIAKKYMIVNFDDYRYNSDLNKSREALIYTALENNDLKFENYQEIYKKFESSTNKQNDIDLEVLKKSLNELGYTNVSQKEVIDILKKYNQIKINESEKE
jgi:transcriptional regulator with XRE-family HTH domain